jgi:hypothetical protein
MVACRVERCARNRARVPEMVCLITIVPDAPQGSSTAVPVAQM